MNQQNFLQFKIFFSLTVYQRNVSLIQKNCFMGVKFTLPKFVWPNYQLLFFLYISDLRHKLMLIFLNNKLFEFLFFRITICQTEKNDLIESKKVICLNDFLWFKEMICSNEIKFVWIKLIFLQNIEINALIYGQRYNLFDLRQKFIWSEQIFI